MGRPYSEKRKAYQGAGNRNLNFNGKKMMLIAERESWQGDVIIDCEGAGRGFIFESGENGETVIRGFVIANGCTTTNDDGGGIYGKNASPAILDCVIENCVAEKISSSARGGGIYWEGSVMPNLKGTVIRRNRAEQGGGVYVTTSGGSPVLRSCRVTENVSKYDGGGIYAKRTGSGKIRIERCMITDNSAGNDAGQTAYGGGLYASGDVAVENSIFLRNSAYTGGGGIYGTSISLVESCTVVENVVRSTTGNVAGGVHLGGSIAPLRNTILWGNESPVVGVGAQYIGGTVSYCCIEGGDTANHCINDEPDLTYDGLLLSIASLCIGAGDPENGATTDIDGEERTTRDIGADQFIDTDGDGLPDAWEKKYGLKADDATGGHGADGDPDDDKVLNKHEYLFGWDPQEDNSLDPAWDPVHRTWTLVVERDRDRDGLDDLTVEYFYTYLVGWPPEKQVAFDLWSWDTDGDLFPDSWEFAYFGEAAANDPTKPGRNDDYDNDGLSNFEEMQCGTNPRVKDTDDDGVNDGAEKAAGSDPADADDLGDPANCVVLALRIGDPSGSNSERYALEVGKHVQHVAKEFGVPETESYAFVKGKEYSYEVHWIASAPGRPVADYDYVATIGGFRNGRPSAGTHLDAGGYFIDDPGLLGTTDELLGSTDTAEGKKGTLSIIEVDLTETEGANDTKFEIATLPEKEDARTWSATITGIQDASVTFKLIRNGTETTIPWKDATGDACFESGVLNVDVTLLDGPSASPEMDQDGAVLEIFGVQQGDKVIVEEPTTGARDSLAVVKNFSWNDLQRLESSGGQLALHQDWGGLDNSLKQALVETIRFALDQAADSNQAAQREEMERAHGDEGLAVLDLPSGFGVGAVSSYDIGHFHYTAVGNSQFTAATLQALDQFRAKKAAWHQTTPVPPIWDWHSSDDLQRAFDYIEDIKANLKQVLQNADDNFHSTLIFHTYETTYNEHQYLGTEPGQVLSVKDPILKLMHYLPEPQADKRPRLFRPRNDSYYDIRSIVLLKPSGAANKDCFTCHFVVGKGGKIMLCHEIGGVEEVVMMSVLIRDALGE